ncbi:MAG: glycosyltransferase [Gammaproteobacteria bacterium]|nr:glycosyltransferase [Gammaproteobacteria bacterium]
MKVLLHINSLAVGGAEQTVAKLAGHWVRCGHQVSVVTQTPVAMDRLPVPPGVQRESTETAGVSSGFFSAVLRNTRRLFRLRWVIRR